MENRKLVAILCFGEPACDGCCNMIGNSSSCLELSMATLAQRSISRLTLQMIGELNLDD